MKRLLDTNAILYHLGGQLAEPLPPSEYAVSVITEMELFSFASRDRTAEAQIREDKRSISRRGEFANLFRNLIRQLHIRADYEGATGIDDCAGH